MIGGEFYTARRWTEGAKDANYQRTWTPTEFEVFGSPQPLKPSELENLSGSLRDRAELKFYLDQDFTLYGYEPGRRGDEVEIDGVWYEVHGLGPYLPSSPLPHTKIILARAEVGEGDEEVP